MTSFPRSYLKVAHLSTITLLNSCFELSMQGMICACLVWSWHDQHAWPASTRCTCGRLCSDNALYSQSLWLAWLTNYFHHLSWGQICLDVNSICSLEVVLLFPPRIKCYFCPYVIEWSVGNVLRAEGHPLLLLQHIRTCFATQVIATLYFKWMAILCPSCMHMFHVKLYLDNCSLHGWIDTMQCITSVLFFFFFWNGFCYI